MNLDTHTTSFSSAHRLPPYKSYFDAQPSTYPTHAVGVPPGTLRYHQYSLRFATTTEDLTAVQRLRFEVFNIELDRGISGSYATGLDQDAFDSRSHHLMVCDHQSGAVVGTYRFATVELAQRDELCSNTEFDLSGMPDRVFRHGAELSRACMAAGHRSGRMIQLLWHGIARYLDWNDKRYVLGCCSVPTLDAAQVASTSLMLARNGHFHRQACAPVRPGLRCGHSDTVVANDQATLPSLFASYLRLGAKVVGGPAIKREAGMVDYLVLLDLRDMARSVLASLAVPGAWTSMSARSRFAP